MKALTLDQGMNEGPPYPEIVSSLIMHVSISKERPGIKALEFYEFGKKILPKVSAFYNS